MKIFKRVLLSLLVVIVAAGGFLFFKLYEKERLDISENEIKNEWLRARPNLSLLQTGDLIFRHGRGFISNSFMQFSRKDQRYSHSGIIKVENGKAYVYHAIGGEENKTNKMRKDPLDVFCNPSLIHSFGIYRLDLTDEQKGKEDSLAGNYYKAGLEFDTDFDMKTDDKMYCSELVYKIITRVVGNENYLSLSAVSGKKYVACDNLYMNEHTKKVYSYNY